MIAKEINQIWNLVKIEIEKLLKLKDNEIQSKDEAKLFNEETVRFNIEGKTLQKRGEVNILGITGWCYNLNSQESVRLQIIAKDEVLTTFICDAARPDVAEAFAEDINNTQLPKCGFGHSVQIASDITHVDLRNEHENDVLEIIDLSDIPTINTQQVLDTNDEPPDWCNFFY